VDSAEAHQDDRAKFEREFVAGNYGHALRIYIVALYRRAVELIHGEGLAIEIHREPQQFTEAAGAIAAALDEHLEREGDAASYKLIIARDVLAAVTETMLLLQRPPDPARDAGEDVAELVLQAVRLGIVETTLGQAVGGFLDEYGALKWREELQRLGRSKGQKASTESKRRRRDPVLGMAQAIIQTNPALSNSELAFKLRQRADLPESVRTIEGWLRNWRKHRQLPSVPPR
jgi:hypothetical protein